MRFNNLIVEHVVRRNNKWCVVHGHPKKKNSKTDKPIGTVIKCYSSKDKANKLHKAIILSELRNKRNK